MITTLALARAITVACMTFAMLTPAYAAEGDVNARIDDLMHSLVGSYRIMPADETDNTPHLTSHYAVVDAPAVGAHTVYWQMNTGDEQKLYRQALLVFTATDGGAIQHVAYSFNKPAEVADGFVRPVVFAALQPEDLRPAINADCVETWTQDKDGWRSLMPAESCRMWSERSQSWRYIGAEVAPRGTELWYVERGINEAGQMIFGLPMGEYYRMSRLPDDFVTERYPTARSIMQWATSEAGGDAWRLADTNLMSGNATLYRGGISTHADRYEMRRVYPRELPETHTGTGKFRLDAYVGDTLLFTLSFDGERMYNQNGPMTPEQAAMLAASSFGFSAVRFALTDGFALERMPDDQVEGHTCWFVQLTDTSGGKTLVGVDKNDAMLRYVGWNTPRGWHHRLYSDHYTLDSGFVQPGRVRLYYDGIKTTDINWTAAELNTGFADETFVVSK